MTLWTAYAQSSVGRARGASIREPKRSAVDPWRYSATLCRHGIDRDKICDACYHERAYESGDE